MSAPHTESLGSSEVLPTKTGPFLVTLLWPPVVYPRYHRFDGVGKDGDLLAADRELRSGSLEFEPLGGAGTPRTPSERHVTVSKFKREDETRTPPDGSPGKMEKDRRSNGLGIRI